ncbi:MAG: nucleotide sugar dehydrogenase [Phycisphaerae bacterium]|nr:nucleotide sugar dehydrogenase [Phycisphaerae bacterium]
MTLLEKIKSKKAVVGVVGLGYVGLPLIREFYTSGYRTVGFDVDAAKVSRLAAGRSYIKHIPGKFIRELFRSGRFKPTTDFSRLRSVDAIIICVPTPLDKMRQPDMTYIKGTAETIAKYLQKGQLVCLESTTYPGTTRELMKPILEESGLKAGRDFYLAYSPEREDPGNAVYTTRTIPKVVGGCDAASGKVAAALYGRIVEEVIEVSSCEVAEATKILENTFRCINIAMVNELKMLFDKMGIDVWEVVRAASTKPFGFMPFYPGPGLGGHCIPIDPFYLSWKARQYDMPTRFIELAGEINVAMPDYVISRVMAALNEKGKSLKGARILVLGLAYKKDVDDLRESPSIVLIEKLREFGARVSYNDPYIPRTHKQRQHDLRMKSVSLTAEVLKRQDAVLIATDHTDYDYDWIVKNSALVIDTRNACANVKKGRHKVVKA